MKRSFILAAAALLAIACDNKPTGFGVDVEARTNMLSSSVRSSIVSARLLVSGAETFTKDIAGVGKAAQSGAFKFRYVPGVHSGTITIRVDGLDGSGTTVAGGTAPPVDVADGKAVDAVLTLAVNGNGVTCMAGTDCISGNCVDGVCCDTVCAGVCESCNQPGLVGQCSPAMMGTDPDNDCAAKLPPAADTDGGVNDDGGMSMVPPTADNPGACGGSCNGNRACTFPDKTTSCGSAVCSTSATVGKFFCDGAGACNEKDTACTDFNCNAGACRTTCGRDSDCQPTDFCNLNINQCVPKHDLGATCTVGSECTSSFCYSGVCCNTTCGDSTQSCNNPGNVGQCQCTGHACPAGVACVLFYRDADGDKFGDSSGNLTNGKAIAGCTGDAVPAGYSANNQDCDDGDSNANPMQTAYFATTSAGVHTFDYNCDGDPNGPEKETPELLGGTCGFCQFVSNGTFFTCQKETTCGTAGNSSAFSCGFVGRCLCCNQTTSAFTSTIPCGQTGTLTNCGTCSVAAGGPNNGFTSGVVQRCH